MKKSTTAIFWLLCVSAMASPEASALEIWLASTDSCNTCDIYEVIANKKKYASGVHYKGESNVIPVLHKDKTLLRPVILKQLNGDSGPQNAHWSIQLTVIVVEGEEVLAFGNIAESADINSAEISPKMMAPPSRPSADHPALDEHGIYRDFFERAWNLEFFIDRALGKSAYRSPPLIHLHAESPISLSQSNVIFWGSAVGPHSNSQFISTRIGQIRAQYFERNEQIQSQIVVLYGDGPNSPANDTSSLVGDQIRFTKASIRTDLSADERGLNSVLTAISHTENSKNLIVQVGHSAEHGSPIWGRLAPITPKEIGASHLSNSASVVMVSGACYGGLYAQAVDCRFFAAHPKVWAAGCQKSSKALAASDDYLRYFFDGMSQKEADANGDGHNSMEEAHWFASVRVEDHQITYTSFDSLADRYFELTPGNLPERLSVKQLKLLSAISTPAERQALGKMLVGLDSNDHIWLKTHVDLNLEAQRKLGDATELSSSSRNKITNMRFKLILPALARRLVYRNLNVDSPALSKVSACEVQSIPEYLGLPSHSR